jgi:mannose-6-phosphate isomerase-like protein (cupin superfamily)
MDAANRAIVSKYSGARMAPVKSFIVFGDSVDVIVDGSMSGGSSAVICQHNSPGDGPPPHMHTREDETFLVLEGDFELLVEGQWESMPRGEPIFAPRGHIHTFRNSGSTTGRLCVFISPAGFEDYLEELSLYSPATDMPKILEISERYGISLYL